MTFHVLFVCTANICRSPMAERLLAARLPADSGIVTSSAGVRALVGYPMDAPSALVLQELGGDPSEHAATQVTGELIDGTDLVLTATSEHRAAILRERPGAMRRAFTVREFARLAAATRVDPDATLRERIAAVGAQRGVAGAAGGGADEIGDPFGSSLEVVRTCGQQVSAAVDASLRVLVVPG